MLRKRRRILVCGLLALSTGCASSVFDGSSNRNTKKKKEGWSWFKKPEYQEPKSMVAIWTEDTLAIPGKPVTRGFGGRLYFYNEKSQAIPVEGELMVYGFDDSSTPTSTPTSTSGPAPTASPSDQELAQAGKKFKFTSEQFTQHFSHSDLGASYSVWIPWDAVGGEQKKVTLLPTFISKDQRVVRGETNKLTLSGKTPAVAANQPVNNTVQLASATIPTNAANIFSNASTTAFDGSFQPANQNAGSGLNTTTIRMSRPIQAGSQATMTPSPQSLQAAQSLYNQMEASFPQLQQNVPSAPVPPGTAMQPGMTAEPGTNTDPAGNQSFIQLPKQIIPSRSWGQGTQPLGMQSAMLSGSQPNQFQLQGQPTSPQIGHQPQSSLRQ